MATPKTNWLGRRSRRALWAFVIVYLGLVLLVAIFQRTLLYHPNQFSLGDGQTYAAQNGLLPWTNSVGDVIGWWHPARAPAVGSVIIAHGNGGSAFDMTDLAADIRNDIALDTYILEFPGYGHRGGSPSETSLLAAADNGFESLPTNLPVYAVSESLGTAVATHLAQKYPARVAGLLLFVPYDRLASVAQRHYPFLPAYFLLLDRFAPTDWLADYHGPVKIVVAGADEIIQPQRGKNLYDHYAGPKSLQIIDGAHHNETANQSPEWWRGVMTFWKTKGEASNSKLP